jgi:hypothetical protein
LIKQVLQDVYRGHGTVVRTLGKQIAYAVIVPGSGHQFARYDEIIHRRIKVRIVFQTVGDASYELYVGQGSGYVFVCRLLLSVAPDDALNRRLDNFGGQ